MSAQLIMYSTPWCGYCRRLKSQLDRDGIPYVEVDIERTPDAAEFVERINGGNRTVPTLHFPNGTALTSETIPAAKLAFGKAAAKQLRSIVLTKPAAVMKDQQFAIVLSAKGDFTIQFGPKGDSYSRGDGYVRSGVGGRWARRPDYHDFAFQTLMEKTGP